MHDHFARRNLQSRDRRAGMSPAPGLPLARDWRSNATRPGRVRPIGAGPSLQIVAVAKAPTVSVFLAVIRSYSVQFNMSMGGESMGSVLYSSSLVTQMPVEIFPRKSIGTGSRTRI